MSAIGRRIAGRRPYLTGDYARDYQELQEALHALIDANDDGLPPKHAATHLALVGAAETDAEGTEDGLVSGADPSTISLDAEADPGDPAGGTSAAGHVHPVNAALRALGSVSTSTVNGKRVAAVQDDAQNSVLEQILLRLDKLVEMKERGR